MKIEVFRERRRTISLKILNSENAVLKAPKRLGEKEINKFLESKKAWIDKSVKRLKETEMFESQFDLKNFVYLGGKRICEKKDVIVGFEKLDERKRLKETTKFYRSFFPKLESFATKISEKTRIPFKKIKMTSSIRVWGSFNSNSEMKLNFKLVILPEELVQYVIVHELCHFIQMNHSAKFWREVEKFCPDYKQKRKSLNQYGFLLKTKL